MQKFSISITTRLRFFLYETGNIGFSDNKTDNLIDN